MLLALSKESAWATVLHPSSSRKHSPSSVHPGNSARVSSSASPLSCVLPLSGCSLLHCDTTFPLPYSTASLNWSWCAAEIRSLSRTLISTECQNHCEINALCSWTANKRWGGADRRKNIVWLWWVKSEFPCCCFDFWWKNYNNECLSKKKLLFLFTKNLRVHMNSFTGVLAFQIELEFGSVGFWGEMKTGVPEEKSRGARERTNNKLNPHMASRPGREPGPHWLEASALTTAPPLRP